MISEQSRQSMIADQQGITVECAASEHFIDDIILFREWHSINDMHNEIDNATMVTSSGKDSEEVRRHKI